MKSIILTALLGACIILAIALDKDDDYIYKPVYSIDSVRTEIQSPGKLALFITATVPDPCYQYAHFKTEKTGSQIVVTPFAKREQAVNCIQVLAKIQFSLELEYKESDQIIINSLAKPVILSIGSL